MSNSLLASEKMEVACKDTVPDSCQLSLLHPPKMRQMSL